jgi:hypothetical protein
MQTALSSGMPFSTVSPNVRNILEDSDDADSSDRLNEHQRFSESTM